MSGVSAKVRQVVLERDQFRCCRCGSYVGPFGDFSVHHRRPRGMGGSKRPETNLPANLLTLCGSGTTGCHGHIEANRDEARAAGLILLQAQTPTAEPVRTHRGLLLLDDEGMFTEVTP